ncbi:MAG: PDZ domain-containing protein [Phycisphaerales bacterium]
MRDLNVRNMLIATAAGVCGVQMLGVAAPCPPGEEKEQKVVATAAYVQEEGAYKVVVPTRVTANTVVLKADKDGRLVEIRVRPVDATKNEYVIAADTISIADVRGKATGNLVLTAEGNVALAALAVKNTPTVQIGVVTEPVSKALAGHLKIQPAEALIVTGVLEGLPAAKAGIKEHDVITRVDGVKVITHVKLKEVLSKCKPGQVIALRVLRAGEPTEVKVRVEAIEPKVQPLTTTYQTWSNEVTNLKAALSFTQPQVGGVVTKLKRQHYLALTEPQRSQTFVVIDPKISTQVLEAKSLVKAYEMAAVTSRNLALAGIYSQLTKAAEGESIEARLLAQLATLEQQLAKLKALIVELEATSNNEDE